MAPVALGLFQVAVFALGSGVAYAFVIVDLVAYTFAIRAAWEIQAGVESELAVFAFFKGKNILLIKISY